MMKLKRSQKKFLKKNLKKLSLREISHKLNVSETELQKYLKSIWSKEKYERFITGKDKYLQGGVKFKKWLKQNWKQLLLLAFLAMVAYANSLTNDFVADDIPAIVENKNIGNFFYYLKHQPLNSLRYFFYFLAYKIGGLNPFFYRLLNLFFHLSSTLVIYGLINLLYSFPLPLIVASIFAVHPVLIEAVVWISGGTHSQYAFFVLLSFWFYLLVKRRWSLKFYLISAISFLLALLTSEKATILPFIILSFEFSQDSLSKTWKKTIPFFILSAVWVLYILFGGFLSQRTAALESGHYQETGLYNPLIQIPVAIFSYLRLIFWPDRLTLYHSEMSFSQIQYLAMFLVSLAFLGMTVFTFVKKKCRQYFFWLSFFMIALLPMLTPFRVAWVVAERYVYLGSLGIFVIIALGIQKIGAMFKNDKVVYIILAIILTALSMRTIARNTDWKNQDALWLAAAKTSPSSPQNHNNLGDLYSRRGDFQRAITEFKKAIELKPGYADAYHNLANIYQQIGETELAIANYQKALEFNPNLWQSYQNLAAVYFEQEKFDLAKEELEKALEINSQNSLLHTNLAIVYLKLGKKEEAKVALETALQLDSQNQKARQLLIPQP